MNFKKVHKHTPVVRLVPAVNREIRCHFIGEISNYLTSTSLFTGQNSAVGSTNNQNDYESKMYVILKEIHVHENHWPD